MKFKSNLLVKELILFSLTMAIGMVAAYQGVRISSASIIIQAPSFSISDLVFLACIIAFFLVATKLNRFGRIVLMIFFVLVVWAGTEIVFDSILPLPWNYIATLVVLAFFLSWRNVLTHNIAIILALAGVGAAIGISITPTLAIIALIALSFYDIIAVYLTKHMVKMAQGMIRSGVIFGFIIPYDFKSFFTRRDKATEQIGQQFMILGSGDVALPLVFASSLMRQSLPEAITVVVFAVFGGVLLTHMLFINQTKRRAMAALPPIATMSLIGYLVALLFKI